MIGVEPACEVRRLAWQMFVGPHPRTANAIVNLHQCVVMTRVLVQQGLPCSGRLQQGRLHCCFEAKWTAYWKHWSVC